jgi:hypothetical protein
MGKYKSWTSVVIIRHADANTICGPAGKPLGSDDSYKCHHLVSAWIIDLWLPRRLSSRQWLVTVEVGNRGPATSSATIPWPWRFDDPLRNSRIAVLRSTVSHSKSGTPQHDLGSGVSRCWLPTHLTRQDRDRTGLVINRLVPAKGLSIC